MLGDKFLTIGEGRYYYENEELERTITLLNVTELIAFYMCNYKHKWRDTDRDVNMTILLLTKGA